MENQKPSAPTVASLDMGDQLSQRLAQLGQEHCVFSRQQQLFAVSVAAAREVLIGESLTTVPKAPPALVGVLNLRGEVLPLVKLDMLLDLPVRPPSPDDQVLVLSSENVELGLIVDRVREVRPIDPKDIGTVPETLPQHPLYKGCWQSPNGPVIVLDASGLVTAAVSVVSTGFREPTGVQSGGAAHSSAA